MSYKSPPEKSHRLLQNKIIDGGIATDQSAIYLPANSTANLAENERKVASIAYDTTLQEIVIDKGAGFVSIGGGGGAVDSVNGETGVVVLDADDVGAASQALDNLTSPTAVSQDLRMAATKSLVIPNAVHLKSRDPANTADRNILSIYNHHAGYLEILHGNAAGTVFLDARFPAMYDTSGVAIMNNRLLISPDGSTQLRWTDNNLKLGLASLIFPDIDGNSGDVLSTDGLGNLSFSPASGINWSTPVDSNVIPDTDITYDLGSDAVRFKDVFSEQANNTIATGLTPDTWGADLPGIVINGDSTDSLAQGASVIILKGGNAGHYLGLLTQDKISAGATSNIFIQSGFNTGAGNSGGTELSSGYATGGGNSGTVSMNSGNSTSGDSGHVSMHVGAAGANSGDIQLVIEAGGSTTGDFKFFKVGANPSVGDVWTASDTVGVGYWATPSAANTTLSNLGTTAINANLVFNKANAVIQTPDGASGSDHLSILTGDSAAVAQSGNIVIQSGDGFASGFVSMKSGVVTEADVTSGSATLATGNSNLGPSGSVFINTGGTNPSGGSAAGNISIETGVGTPGGMIDIRTGNSVITGNNGPDLRLFTGDAQVAASGGNFVFTAGQGEGVGHQGDVDMTLTRAIKLSSLAADPTGDLVAGTIYYNTGTNKIKMYNGATWETITSV